MSATTGPSLAQALIQARQRPECESLAQALTQVPQKLECESLAQWLPIWRAVVDEHHAQGPYAAAVLAALRADRMAWAFFCGYQGAMRTVFPSRSSTALASFCANESGKRITEIDTALARTPQGLTLGGCKSWLIANMPEPDLFVVARAADGPPNGPGSLAVVRVPASAAGVRLGEGRAQTAIPEVGHCGVAFEAVAIAETDVLPGDGYADYAKPFRYFEDVFITGCRLAALLGHGHVHHFPEAWRERCLAAIVLLETCSQRGFADPSTELLASGAFAFAGDVLGEGGALLAEHDAPAAARWQRDASLGAIGEAARRRRVEQARAAVGWRVENA